MFKQDIHITTDEDRLAKQNADDEDGSSLDHIELLSPQDAVGELVEFEMPGTMGHEIYQIRSVHPEEKKTKLKHLQSETIYIADNSFLPPSWNRFTRPEPGTRYTVEWKEHLNGKNEWVQTTPEVDVGRAETYHGRYHGHERTRCIEQTRVYTPAGITEHDIYYSARENKLKVQYHDSEELDKIEIVLNQVKTVPDSFTEVGHLYVNNNNEIVWFNIDHEYTDSNSKIPITALKQNHQPLNPNPEITETTTSN